MPALTKPMKTRYCSPWAIAYPASADVESEKTNVGKKNSAVIRKNKRRSLLVLKAGLLTTAMQNATGTRQ